MDAFRAYHKVFPESTTLLLDTYDTLQAARLATEFGLQLRGVRLQAIGQPLQPLLVPIPIRTVAACFVAVRHHHQHRAARTNGVVRFHVDRQRLLLIVIIG